MSANYTFSNSLLVKVRSYKSLGDLSVMIEHRRRPVPTLSQSDLHPTPEEWEKRGNARLEDGDGVGMVLETKNRIWRLYISRT